MSHVASCVRSKRAGEVRTAAFFSIFPGSSKSCRTRPNTLSANCQVCTTSSNNWPTSTSQSNRWKLGQQRITSWAACTLIPIRKCPGCLVCSQQANAPPASTARTAWAATRSPIFWFSENAPANSLRSSRKKIRGGQFRDDYPDKNEQFAKVKTMSAKATDGSMQVRLEPLAEMPDHLKRVIEENR